MNTLKISLSEELQSFVDAEAAAAGHSSASDFVLALVKEAKKKQAWAKAEELVQEGLRTPARPLTDDDWKKLRQRIRRPISRKGAKK